jgi:hypothetical protein
MNSSRTSPLRKRHAEAKALADRRYHQRKVPNKRYSRAERAYLKLLADIKWLRDREDER